MGCMFPKADDLASYWANIRRGVDAIAEVPPTHWRPDDYFDPDPKAPDHTYARRGGFLSPVDFPPLDFGIAPNNLEATDTTQLLGLMVARAALEDAGYGQGSKKPLDRDRVSVILGVTGTLELVIPLGARLGHPIWRRALQEAGVADNVSEEVVRRIADSYVSWQENSFPGLLGNVAAGRIANRLDLGGTNCVVDAACASSIAALNLAVLELATGRCDLALSGGLDTFNDIFMYMCFSKTPALSPRGDARPFDAGCDGTVLGEGLGVLALKRLDDAKRDGDRIYAVIRGVGTSSDGQGTAVYAPSAAGQVKALREAYRVSGVSPESIELVEAHGTGTKVGDATELAALTDVYGTARPDATWCALGSVKSQVGHTKAAAGAAGVIKAAMALHQKILPPTIKVDQPLPGLEPGRSPFYLNTQARPWLARADHPRRAAVSAFGFGGSNFHCILEEAEEAKPGIEWDGSVQILAFSANSESELSSALDAWPKELTWHEFRAEAARTRLRFRNDQPHRLVMVVNASDDVNAKLADVRALIRGTRSRSAPGTFKGTGPAPGRLAMLFPGQGSQYVGMLREITCLFPQMQAALKEADSFAPTEGLRVSDVVYPFSCFTDGERRDQESRLLATEVAQPAIGAVSLGLFRILDEFGVRPDAVAGHSFGELTALRAAGRLDDRAFASLAQKRGWLMASQNGGAMLAVSAPIEAVEETLRSQKLNHDLVIANRNAPAQFVLSGPKPAIEQAARAFEDRRISTRTLAVSAAFHSPTVARASEPFLNGLREVRFGPATVPVFSNTTAGPYPDDADEARALLAGQLAKPVAFSDELRALQGWGVATFLEVGPDSKLCGLVRATLDARAIALDASKGARGNLADLAAALAELAALGYPVQLARWDEGCADIRRPQQNSKLTVKICGANSSTASRPRPAVTPRLTPATKLSMTSSPPPRPARSNSTALDRPPIHAEVAAHPESNGHPTPPPKAPHKNGEAAVPMSIPSRSTRLTVPLTDNNRISDALSAVQENLLALQKLSAQTAELHKQFLEGQETTQRSFQSLLEQQQRLKMTSLEAPSRSPHVSLPVTPQRDVAEANGFASDFPVPTPAQPLTAHRSDSNGRATESMPVRMLVDAPSAARATLFDVVAEKTGYPAEMLEPGMRLDADLGIDSIKRVEILSALQERLPGTPPITPEQLGTLQTLQDILAFLSHPTDAASHVSNATSVDALLLAVVAEKTGYPAEMLESRMRLDADLGIDSIKRVEILSTLQERLPDAPAVTPEQLGTLQTLGDISILLDARPQAVAPAPALRPADVQAVLLEVVAEKTGYPAEMLEPSMMLVADLGIDSIKRVEILSALQERLPNAPAVKPEQLGALLTLRDVVELLDGAVQPAAMPVVSVALSTKADMPLQRLVVRPEPVTTSDSKRTSFNTGAEAWVFDDGSGLAASLAKSLGKHGTHVCIVRPDEIAGLPAPDRLDALVLLASPRESETAGQAVKTAFRVLRIAAPALRRASREHAVRLITVSRMDGAFGTLRAGFDFESGALAGLAKTVSHEWPEVECKAIDVDPDLENPADAIVDEILRSGPIEVGISSRGRTTLGLAITPLPIPNTAATPIGPGDVIVVTGGARGVTAEVAVALAEAFRPTLVLFGRSPAPTEEPDWLASLA